MAATARKRKDSAPRDNKPKDGETDEFEFGGSLGAASLMIGFPSLMWCV